MSAAFVAAMDIGGTHARLAVQPDGSGPAFFDAPGFTLMQNSAGDVQRRCRALLAPALDRLGLAPGQCAALCCGAAGVDDEASKRVYCRIFERLGFPPAAVHVWNDCELPLAAHGSPAVLIAAGTGSAVLARGADNAIVRCGGWGWLTSDEGSACRIALDALAHAVRVWDGVCAPGALSALLQGQAHLAGGAQAEAFARRAVQDKSGLAALAPLVCRAAQAGDRAARRILGAHAQALAQSADAAARAAGLSAPTALLWGSLLTQTNALRAPLAARLRRLGFADVLPLAETALNAGLRLAAHIREEKQNGSFQH